MKDAGKLDDANSLPHQKDHCRHVRLGWGLFMKKMTSEVSSSLHPFTLWLLGRTLPASLLSNDLTLVQFVPQAKGSSCFQEW